MFIEITQPDSFSWVSILVTSLASIISAGLGAWISYIFLTHKDKREKEHLEEVTLEIIREKLKITKNGIDFLKENIKLFDTSNQSPESNILDSFKQNMEVK